MTDFTAALDRIQELAVQLLVVVVLVAMIVRRLRIPHTVTLVLAGLAISAAGTSRIELRPELILAIFVPPLIFEAAFHIRIQDLQALRATIGVLAVPGVLATTLIVGLVVFWGTPLDLPTALVFGAVMSATDPVAVVALFKTLAAPRKLATLMEGESIFNDGTAIVVYNIVLAAVLTGRFSLGGGVVEFLQVAVGGMLVGLVLGWLASQVFQRVDDYLIETTISTVLAYGSFLLAERFHLSGVLAVGVAGVFNGNLSQRAMSPTTRIGLRNFWDFIAFLSNSVLFLLIGLAVPIEELIRFALSIGWAVGAVLLARALVVFPLMALASRYSHEVPARWSLVSFWGGLRGAVSLALGLSLPAALGARRDELLAMTFGVVLFTILVQGISMNRLLGWLGISQLSESMLEFQRRLGRARSIRAGRQHLESMYNEGLISPHTWEALKGLYERQHRVLDQKLHKLLHDSVEVSSQEVRAARRELLLAERASLEQLLGAGVVSEEVYGDLTREIDDWLLSEDLGLPSGIDMIAESLSGAQPVVLLLATIPAGDVPSFRSALESHGLPPILAPDGAGPEGTGVQTILIGAPASRVKEVAGIQEQVSRKPVRPDRSELPSGHVSLTTLPVEKVEVW